MQVERGEIITRSLTGRCPNCGAYSDAFSKRSVPLSEHDARLLKLHATFPSTKLTVTIHQ